MEEEEESKKSGGELTLEEAQKERKKLEAQAVFEAGKNKYLQDTLESEIVRGKPRVRLIYEAYYFMIFFIVFVSYVGVTKIDTDGLQLVEGIDRTLFMQPLSDEEGNVHVRNNLQDISDLDGVYNWMAYVLYPAICLETGYGKLNRYNMVLYGVRLRQLRMSPEIKSIKTGSLHSFEGYQLETYPEFRDDDQQKTPWHGQPWRSPNELKNDIFEGFDYRIQSSYSENSYPGGGYVIDFPLDHQNGTVGALQNQVLQLRNSGWTDKNTRALIIQLSTFNPQDAKFASISVICEKSIAGTVMCTPNVLMFKMLAFDSHSAKSIIIILLVVQIIFYTILFTYQELALMVHPNIDVALGLTAEYDADMVAPPVYPIYQRPIMYFKKFRDYWEVIHVVNIIFFIYSLYTRGRWYLTPEVWDFRVSNLVLSFPNLFPFAMYTKYLSDLTALNVFLSFFKLFKFMRLNVQLNVLWLTLTRASSILFGFCLMCLLIFAGFSFMGFVIFGAQMRTYYTPWASASTLFQMLLGDFDYEGISYVNQSVAAFFFYLYMVVVFLTMINIFISILQESYNDVSQTMAALKEPDAVMTWLELFLGKWAQAYWDKVVAGIEAEVDKVEMELEEFGNAANDANDQVNRAADGLVQQVDHLAVETATSVVADGKPAPPGREIGNEVMVAQTIHTDNPAGTGAEKKA